MEGEKSKKGCLFGAIFLMGIILACGIIILITVIYLSSSILGFSGDKAPSSTPLEMEYVSGAKNADKKIAIININGIVLSRDTSWKRTASSKKICDMLEKAAKDDTIKGVLLKIDSPGGEITATDKIYHYVEKVKEKGKPVVASLGAMATSGGYYIAAAADYIVSNRLTTTGSIGVIINNYNYHELLDKIGIKDEVYKSGKMKDLLNPARPRTSKEKEIVNNIIQESYNKFVKIVSNTRISENKNLTKKYIKNSKIGDGRIFTGEQAHKLGLVDELGYKEDALQKLAKLSELKENNYKVVRFKQKLSLSEILQKFVTDNKKLQVKIPGMELFKVLESGKSYYLYVGYYN